MDHKYIKYRTSLVMSKEREQTGFDDCMSTSHQHSSLSLPHSAFTRVSVIENFALSTTQMSNTNEQMEKITDNSYNTQSQDHESSKQVEQKTENSCSTEQRKKQRNKCQQNKEKKKRKAKGRYLSRRRQYMHEYNQKLSAEKKEKNRQYMRKRYRTLCPEKKEERKKYIKKYRKNQALKRQEERDRCGVQQRGFCYDCRLHFFTHRTLLKHIIEHVTQPKVLLCRCFTNISQNEIDITTECKKCEDDEFNNTHVNVKSETECETDIEIDDVSFYTYLKKEKCPPDQN